MVTSSRCWKREAGISRDPSDRRLSRGVVIDPGISCPTHPTTASLTTSHCIAPVTGRKESRAESSRMLRLFAQAAAAVILSCVTDARSPLPRDVQATAARSPLSEARSPRQMAAARPNDRQCRMETSPSLGCRIHH